jgi:hypothetical protein
VYYSLYIHGLLQLGLACNYDLAVLYEAIFAMTLTPCQEGWYRGMMAAIRPEIRNGRNLIDAFVDFMLEDRGGVMRGERRRRQSSTRSRMDRRQMFRSLRNMYALVYYGGITDNTTGLVDVWSGSNANRGVQGAGGLTGQEQVVVFAYMRFIRECHGKNARVVKGCAAANHFRDEYGITKEERLQEALRFVSIESGDDQVTVENGWCEEYRNFDACDTLAGGQKLYKLVAGRLLGTDARGYTSEVPLPEWEFDRLDYRLGVRWWSREVDVDSIRGEIVLSIPDANN